MIALVLLLAAQPQVAPPPREVVPRNPNLTWTYSGPKLEIEAKDGKVVARWTRDGKAYTATGAKVGVRDGVVSVVGTEKEPAQVTSTGTQLSGLRIDITVEAGTFEVMGASLVRQP